MIFSFVITFHFLFFLDYRLSGRAAGRFASLNESFELVRAVWQEIKIYFHQNRFIKFKIVLSYSDEIIFTQDEASLTENA